MTQNSSPWLWQIHSPFIHRGEDEDRASSQLGITVHQVDICSQSFLCALLLQSVKPFLHQLEQDSAYFSLALD